jgi:hypothetical protein
VRIAATVAVFLAALGMIACKYVDERACDLPYRFDGNLARLRIEVRPTANWVRSGDESG